VTPAESQMQIIQNYEPMGSQELIVKKKEFDKHLELNVIENIEK